RKNSFGRTVHGRYLMRPMGFYLIVRSAQRRTVSLNSGAITLVVAKITQPPNQGSATVTPDDAWATGVAVFSKWPLPQANLNVSANRYADRDIRFTMRVPRFSRQKSLDCRSTKRAKRLCTRSVHLNLESRIVGVKQSRRH